MLLLCRLPLASLSLRTGGLRSLPQFVRQSYPEILSAYALTIRTQERCFFALRSPVFPNGASSIKQSEQNSVHITAAVYCKRRLPNIGAFTLIIGNWGRISYISLVRNPTENYWLLVMPSANGTEKA